MNTLVATILDRSLARGLLLAAGFSVCIAAQAACKTELPDPALHGLDAQADRDPIGTVDEVRRRLAEAPPTDALTRAQWYAVASDASETVADDRSTKEFASAGLRSLEADRTARADGVRRRLQLSWANGATTRAELEAAVTLLDGLVGTAGADRLERTCLHLVRSRVASQLRRDVVAVRDAIEADELASTLDRPDVRAETASQMARVYGGAGLDTLAVPAADRALLDARRAGAPPAIANALYFAVMVRIEAGQFEAAQPLIVEQRALSARLQDALGLAFAGLQACQAYAGLHLRNAARDHCGRAVREFTEHGRPDQGGRAQVLLARLDLDDGQATRSLRRLDAVLRDPSVQLPPDAVADAVTLRAEVLGRLGQDAAAARDYRHALALQSDRARERARWVAALLEARRSLDAAHRERDVAALREQSALERAADVRTRARYATAAAVAAGLCALALGALLWLRIRHERRTARLKGRIEQQARVMDAMRDGVAICDAAGIVRYANGAFVELVGRDASAVVGTSLGVLGLLPEDAPLDAASDASRTVFERTLVRDDPGAPPLFVRVEYLRVGTGPAATQACVLQDVTDRRRMEWDVLEQHRREQNHVSRLLHEDLAQDLGGIAMLLASVRPTGVEDAGALAQLTSYLREAVEKARGIARGLSPVRLSNGSVTKALERLVASLQEGTGTRVHVRASPGLDALGASLGDHLYATAVAGITLVADRLAPRDMRLEVRLAPTRVELEIAADARPSDALDGVDLDRLAYRVRAAGGAVRVEHDAATGFRLTAWFPRVLPDDTIGADPSPP